MTIRNRETVFNPLIYNLLICVGLLGFIASPASLAGDGGEQREARNDFRDDRGGKARLKRCLRALSQGKKPGKECSLGGSSGGIAKGDFNGDGFGDLAIGVPGESVLNNTVVAGAVNVIYGSGGGLTATTAGIPAAQFWSQSSPGVPAGSESNDGFGSALAAGDFNDDGFSDLAIGTPGEDTNDGTDTGAITVIYGSAAGLTTTNADVPAARFFSLQSVDPTDRFGHAGARFGSSLVWADFNCDGIGDLAIGAPRTALTPPFPASLGGPASNAGLVAVMFGQAGITGLTAGGAQLLHQNADSSVGGIDVSSPFALLRDTVETGDQFGFSLAAGQLRLVDESPGPCSDLAIGVPFEELSLFTPRDSGAVYIVAGGRNGFAGAISVVLSQGSGSDFEPDEDEEDDRYGWSLAVGDFERDGLDLDRLAVGVPFENLGTVTDAGAVYITNLGGTFGLDQTRVYVEGGSRGDIVKSSTVPDSPETADQFGRALAAGDFDGDGDDDLAVGVPFENLPDSAGVNQVDAGAVNVFFSTTTTPPTFTPDPTLWSQATPGIDAGGEPEVGDRFGSSLTAWNFGRNGTVGGLQRVTADLAIGAPLENVGNVSNAGAVNVIYGSFITFDGLETTGDQVWTQGSVGVPGGVEADDHFGEALY